MATKNMTHYWIIYLCFIIIVVGSGILCYITLDRRQTVSSCFVNTNDLFNCTNGVCIKSSMVCDGRNDCSDGLDEIKELCARKEFETNMATDCGKVYKNQVFINNGQKTIIGMAPWLVGIYKFYKSHSNYSILCEGSIISSNLVVSAAHCFWNINMSSNILLIDDGLYKIAVGKYENNITVIDNIFTQIIDVEIVYLKEDYYGQYGLYTEDIAIVVLKNPVSFSYSVAPVCLDWNVNYDQVNGNKGKIVSWATTNYNSLSPILFESSLPYIDRMSCRRMYNNDFKQYVIYDKFCAGSVLEQGVHVRYYNGAGLSFFHNNSYYLAGVASLKDQDANNSISLFTDVKYHIQWIRRLYNRYTRRAISSSTVTRSSEEEWWCRLKLYLRKFFLLF